MNELSDKILPKKSIQSLVSYRPQVKEEINSNQIRLSVNEGALGIGPKAKNAIKNWNENFTHNFHRYPFQINVNLVEAISKRYKLISENIIPGNGSDELIQLLCHAFLEKNDEAIFTQYGFLVFPQAIKISGGIPVKAKDKNFTVCIKEIINKINHKTKIIFIANPNNPTGTMVPEKDLRELIKHTPKNILIVIDSAYAEYVLDKDYCDGSILVQENNNVVMLRTFSKIHGLASFRLGWAYCSDYVASILKSIRAPFSVNSLASHAGSAAIQDTDFEKISVINNQKLMKWTHKKLKSLNIKILPSVANFFLIDLNSEDEVNKLVKYLESKNIFVREMKPYNLPSFIRVSIGNEKEMKIFCDEFSIFLNKKRL